MKLRIADDFTLPIDAVTNTFAILAKRGAGKTYTASVHAEEMLAAGQQIVVIDPTGAWWGLQSSADGKSPGFPIVVLGGDHANLPLEESAGEAIASAVVANRFPAVLDVSLFRKGQVRRFLTQFLETFYRLNREPVHLFIDEADDVCPQRTFGDEAQLVGAIEDVVKRGRKKGIGCTLITQRPADLAKQVLTQCETLVTLRLSHPRDLAAIREWINVHADPDEAKAMIESLPSLPIGTAWYWSPGWGHFFQRVGVRRRTTFDSSSTPKPGATPAKPKKLAEINLTALGADIEAAAAAAKENDPRELRKRIADLEKQLSKSAKNVQTERVEVPVLTDKQLEVAGYEISRLNRLLDTMAQLVKELNVGFAKINPKIPPTPKSIPKPIKFIRDPKPNVHGDERLKLAGAELAGPEQRILDAVAWLESIGNAEPEQTAVAFLAGYTIGGGAFNNPKGKLRGRGLIEYRGDCLLLTDDGRALAEIPQGALTAEELQARVMQRLPGPERKILAVLIEQYPNDAGKDELAAAAGYAEGGGAFNNPLGRLRSLGLIEYPTKGRAIARSVLFLT